MADFLMRYRQGEYVQVWAELLDLGDGVREQAIYDEALAVARETMTRARANIELLVPRLHALGYQFAKPDRVFVPADENYDELVAEVQRQAGPLPLSLLAWCEVVGEVNFMGAHPKLSTYYQRRDPQEMAGGFLSLVAQRGGPMVPGDDPLRRGFELTQSLLKEVVDAIQTGQRHRSPELEAGIHATRQLVAELQRPLAVETPEIESDPLVVEPYFGDVEDAIYQGHEGDEQEQPDGPISVIIAPDVIHKTNQSGGSPYYIEIPNAAVDATLDGDEDYGTFVEYLRTCFRLGGFPGLRSAATPPREELQFLTEGLLPL
jgi:hypothetical protein